MVQFGRSPGGEALQGGSGLLARRMRQEELPLVSANEAFSESERDEIKDALSAALGSEVRTRTRFEESFELSPNIIIALEYMGAALLAGFLAKMGSDLWDYSKKKILEVALKPKSSNGTRVQLHFQYEGAKVICSI